MAYSLSRSKLRECEEALAKADPYTLEELNSSKPEMEFDQDRLRATTAKQILDMYYQHHPEEK